MPNTSVWEKQMRRVKPHIASYSNITSLADAISEIRAAANKAWVLGNDRFKQRIQNKLGRRIEPKPKGGDRKSEQFRINRVCDPIDSTARLAERPEYCRRYGGKRRGQARRAGCPLALLPTQVWVAADTQQQLLDRLSILERIVFNSP